MDCSSLLLFYIIGLLVSFYAYATVCLESFLLGYFGFLFGLWVKYSRTALDIVVCPLVNGTLVSIHGMNIIEEC